MDSDNVIVKGGARLLPKENNESSVKLGSSDPNKPPIIISDVYIHPDSDPFDKTKDYVGLIIYLHKGQREFTFNGKDFKTGDIIIKQSDRVLAETPKSNRSKSNHRKLFFWIFGRYKRKKLGFVCAGFSYHQGQWKYNSGSLNTMNPNNNDDTYHNTDRHLSGSEKYIIQKVIAHLYENHHWLSCPPKTRFSLEWFEPKAMLLSKKYQSRYANRMFHGIVKSFNDQRGYGFIKCIGFENDIFVHHSNIIDQPFNWRSLNSGENVSFKVAKSDRGWQATEVIRAT